MILKIDAQKLEAYLKADPDCEEISTGEFVADFYDTETPITLNLSINGDKVVCEAAAYLLFDEEQDGWYMGEQISDTAVVEAILSKAIA